LKTGRPLDEPADEDLAVYPVKVEGNKIFVALG
jgi:nitrite reductase/ring-hydroxylating ferredoxin subunit